jgi:hypothetical protein
MYGLHVLLDHVTLVRADDEHIFCLGKPWQRIELVKGMIQYGLSGQIQERLGTAPGMRTHP